MKRIFALSLALLLFVSTLPIHTLAAQEPESKEEVVYVNLNADGTVKEIVVVNIFDLKESGIITDHGDYSAVRNMTTTDAITYTGDTVTIQTGAGKLYYEGKLNSTVMPWNVSVHYYLDGKEYSAQDVAGRSGALKITVDISRNEASDSMFFDAFALQVNLTLDTAKCSNIVAKSATIANVGRNKQLTHTILPGSGAHLEITTDVVDFTMDGIAINAIPLNLNVELDEDMLSEDIGKLLGAIKQLDTGAERLKDGLATLQSNANSDLQEGVDSIVSGAKELNNGALSLQQGGTALNTGARELQTGIADLHQGLQAMKSGVQTIQTALNTLNSQSAALNNGSAAYQAALIQLQTALNAIAVTDQDLSALTAASSQILAGITEVANGADQLQQNVSFAALKAVMAANGLDVDSLKQNNAAAAALLRRTIDENRELADVLGFGEMLDSLESVILLLNANNAFIDGTGVYLDTLNSHTTTLTNGAAMLLTSYTEFNDVIQTLASAMGSLSHNMSQLTNAVNTLVAEYGNIHSGIHAYTGAIAEITAGYTEVANGAARLASGSSELMEGADKLYDGTGELLTGISTLYRGTSALSTGVTDLDAGVARLLDGVATLFDGSKQLEAGTSTMLDESDGIGETITKKVDELLAEISGRSAHIMSFTSDRNGEVAGVQFVIRTAAVQTKAEASAAVTPEPPLTFWQRLLNLFGF